MEQHPSFGLFTSDQLAKWLNAPPRSWHKDVRRIDPLFGLVEDDGLPKQKYRITVDRQCKLTETCEIDIDATSPEDAEKRADMMLGHWTTEQCLKWQEVDRDEYDSVTFTRTRLLGDA